MDDPLFLDKSKTFFTFGIVEIVCDGKYYVPATHITLLASYE